MTVTVAEQAPICELRSDIPVCNANVSPLNEFPTNAWASHSIVAPSQPMFVPLTCSVKIWLRPGRIDVMPLILTWMSPLPSVVIAKAPGDALVIVNSAGKCRSR